MTIENLIEEKFKQFIVRIEAKEFLFMQIDAIHVIDEVEKYHGIILGLDFWQTCDDGDVKEVNSTAWDDINSGSQASENTIKAARNLIGKNLPNEADYVSFVFANQIVNG